MDEMWSFGNSGWTKVLDYWPKEFENEEDALKHAGYECSTSEQWGSQGVEAVEIVQHRKEHERWLVHLTLDGSVHSIEIRGLPNLLSLVGSLGIFAIASQMKHLEATLDAAIMLLNEDSEREYERRHPRRSR
jgi:hypothetical protein